MSERIVIAGLQIDRRLYDFFDGKALPGTGLDSGEFWRAFAMLVEELTTQNRRLLNERRDLQARIDRWHTERSRGRFDRQAYRRFLESIGYLEPEGEPFEIGTTGTDPEIAETAGPQLVVPVLNARFALNAANARWGSLYDALYGTDVIGDDDGAVRGGEYNPRRGAKVIDFCRRFLDDIAPLTAGTHRDSMGYFVRQGALHIAMASGAGAHLRDSTCFAGFRGRPNNPEAILLRHNGLHAEVRIDRNHPVGQSDPAGIADIALESAVTTIMDLEDSIAAVDAEDKAGAYANWLGLIRGDLSSRFHKDGRTVTRALAEDRNYLDPDGNSFRLQGRSLMLVRNVGLLMTSPAVLDGNGNEVFEGLLDAMATTLIGMHDVQGKGLYRNSRCGSIYVVKPKLHGSKEAAFTDTMFRRVEQLLGLPRNTVKVGIMDEERRTSVNLAECVRAVKDRVFFINTGFLDRTGDEIRTSMHAGPMMRKSAMKTARWLEAYEDRNVDVGLACGFPGRAQIGKGMWPMPDRMADMLATKHAHPAAGASTAWVPSPTAATIHALHYHRVPVTRRQRELAGREAMAVDSLLQIPVADASALSAGEVQNELDNNIQGILGYVVHWIDRGIGCSKVPDINGVGLMEDRATLRIASQHVANWLLHGVCNEQQVRATMQRIAALVDEQNAGDPAYRRMAEDPADSVAFQAAADLIFKALGQENGYTEPILHRRRREAKQRRLRDEPHSRPG